MNGSIQIGDVELELMRHICDAGQSSIREIQIAFGEQRGIKRGTIIQMVERLRKKGLLTRKDVAKILRYETALTKEDLDKGVISTFIDQLLGGSYAPFVQFLNSSKVLTDDEEAQLKGLIAKLDKRQDR